MKFTIMGRLASLNDIIGRTNHSRWAGATLKKKQTELCRFWINAARLPKVTKPIYVHFDWHEPNKRRDPDNTRTGAKFILDALVEAQILPTDGRKWVKGLSDTFPEPDALNPRVEVTITEVQS